MSVAFRDAAPGDQHFIIDSWVSSYQDAHAAGMIAVEDWFAVMIPQVEKLLKRPDVRTLIAYETSVGQLADIYGFVTVDTERRVPVVFYVFVKEGYRKAGHARMLLKRAGVDPLMPFQYACKTGVLTELATKIPCAKWDPKLARYSKNDPYWRKRNR